MDFFLFLVRFTNKHERFFNHLSNLCSLLGYTTFDKMLHVLLVFGEIWALHTQNRKVHLINGLLRSDTEMTSISVFF